jgi:hypothetical protein
MFLIICFYTGRLAVGDVRRDKDWTSLEAALLSLSLGGAPCGAGDGACCDAPLRCQAMAPERESPRESAEDVRTSACVTDGAGIGAGAHARAVAAVPAAEVFPGNGKPWALGVTCCVLEGNRRFGPRAVATGESARCNMLLPRFACTHTCMHSHAPGCTWGMDFGLHSVLLAAGLQQSRGAWHV